MPSPKKHSVLKYVPTRTSVPRNQDAERVCPQLPMWSAVSALDVAEKPPVGNLYPFVHDRVNKVRPAAVSTHPAASVGVWSPVVKGATSVRFLT